MKKVFLASAVAIVAVGAVAFSGSANAACYWNGYNWDCTAPQAYQQPGTYQYGYQPSYGYGYTPQQQVYYGQYPQWNSAPYPGPKASGGHGY